MQTAFQPPTETDRTAAPSFSADIFTVSATVHCTGPVVSPEELSPASLPFSPLSVSSVPLSGTTAAETPAITATVSSLLSQEKASATRSAIFSVLAVFTVTAAVISGVVFSSTLRSALSSSNPVTVKVRSSSSDPDGSCGSSGVSASPAAAESVTISLPSVSSSASGCKSVLSCAVTSVTSSDSSSSFSGAASVPILTAPSLLSSTACTASAPETAAGCSCSDSCAVSGAGESSRLLSSSSDNIIISVEAVSASAADTVVPTEPINIVTISPVVISLQSFFLIIRCYSPLIFLFSSSFNLRDCNIFATFCQYFDASTRVTQPSTGIWFRWQIPLMFLTDPVLDVLSVVTISAVSEFRRS